LTQKRWGLRHDLHAVAVQLFDSGIHGVAELLYVDTV
jgi:hypothetical protein